MCNNDNCKCISEILTVISILQQNASCCDSCLETCDRGFLGCGTSLTCNTRPVMLFMCNGTALSMPTEKDSTETTTDTSNVFRVEKLEGCCCTFRVLSSNDDGTYSATNSFCTVNLNCVCCIRCLSDTYVECI